MITKVVLRRFKRFKEIEVPLGDHVVFAGPNNLGKTTVLQAISAWSLAFSRWSQRGDFARHGKFYSKAHITRQTFSSVSLRGFDLLWEGRNRQKPVEIELHTDTWTLAMEFVWDNDDAVSVRPRPSSGVTPAVLREIALSAVYVPPMTGLQKDEPVYQPMKQEDLLGQGRPGEILRNLLVSAWNEREVVWDPLNESMRRIFSCTLLTPASSQAHIVAEYQERDGGPRFDIGSAGSGFQQVLMLLAFLYTRKGSVLLVDEPDAHLHMILQGVVYSELRKLAARQGSQLIIATHSEVVINQSRLEDLRVLTGAAVRRLRSPEDKQRLKQSLVIVQQADVVAAMTAPGVLYIEGRTDRDLLLAWARALQHRAEAVLLRLLVKFVSGETDDDPVGAPARQHYDALSLFFDPPPRALEILDGDSKNKGPDKLDGDGLKRLRWRRYEIESYLIHPRAIARLVEEQHVGEDFSSLLDAVTAWFDRHFKTHEPQDFVSGDEVVEAVMGARKARGEKKHDDGLMTTLLEAAQVRLTYVNYSQIAERMQPEDIHPEIVERLDQIVTVFT